MHRIKGILILTILFCQRYNVFINPTNPMPRQYNKLKLDVNDWSFFYCATALNQSATISITSTPGKKLAHGLNDALVYLQNKRSDWLFTHFLYCFAMEFICTIKAVWSPCFVPNQVLPSVDSIPCSIKLQHNIRITHKSWVFPKNVCTQVYAPLY